MRPTRVGMAGGPFYGEARELARSAGWMASRSTPRLWRHRLTSPPAVRHHRVLGALMEILMSQDVRTAIVELDRDAAPMLVTQRLEAGDDPLEILGDCRAGMTIIGERFQEGEYFLAELLISAEIFKEAAALLDPHLGDADTSESAGVIVLATMRGIFTISERTFSPPCCVRTRSRCTISV